MRIHKIAAASALSLVTAGAMIAASSPGAGAAPAVHRVPSAISPNATVTISPSKQLVDGQQITVHMSGFTKGPPGETLHIGECSFQIVTHQSQSYCAQPSQAATATTDASGKATATYIVRTKSWKPIKPGLKCDPNHGCDIIVTDSLDPNAVQNAGIAPLDLGKKTTTKVTGKKKLKAGKTLKLKAKTSNAFKPTGKVTFKDGHKKIKTVTEKSTGVVTASEKHMKKGKHKITVSYSGDDNNKASKGTLTVKVKK